MADNITILDGAGASKVIAAEDVASVFYPRHNVQGYIAHDSAIAGNPVRLGARALTAAYTAVATGDTADLISTLTGALVTKPYCIPELAWSFACATGGINNSTTAVTIKAAAAAGIKNYLTRLDVSAQGTVATASEIAIRDGAAGTVLWRQKLAAAVQNPIQFNFDPPLAGSAATLMEFVTLTAMGASSNVIFSAQGFIAP